MNLIKNNLSHPRFIIFTVCPSTKTGPGCAQCLPRLTGKDCDKCKLGYFGFPDCIGTLHWFNIYLFQRYQVSKK